MEEVVSLYVTEQDMERLRALLENVSERDRMGADALDEEVSRAKVVPASDIPPGVVTMNSRVCFVDEVTGKQREITLVYPTDANAERRRVSVLAPVGSALLGLSVGQSINWTMPNGEINRFRIVKVIYQPEASGDSHL